MYRLSYRFSHPFHPVNSIMSAPRLRTTVRGLGSSRVFSFDQKPLVRENSGSVKLPQPTTKTIPRRLYFKLILFHRMIPNHQHHKNDLTLHLSVPDVFAKLEDWANANVRKENPTTAKSENSANAQEENPTAEYVRKIERLAWRGFLVFMGCMTVYIHYLHATTPPL